jgi:hypothetical protein
MAVSFSMRAWIVLSVPLGLLLSLSGSDGAGKARGPSRDGLEALTAKIDTALETVWTQESMRPAPATDDLQFARRLWVDLLGTIPSLQEIRKIEARPAEGRREWLIEKALADPRFEDVLGERLARIAVGGPMAKQDDLLYRRRRLVRWMSGQVHANRPWDDLVRELVTAEGLSTDKPATNFFVSQDRDPLKLAARTTRAFLGVRIDCAQCHDHPFTRWTQSDFEGLAAWFARTESGLGGVVDKKKGELELCVPLVGDAAELTALAASGETEGMMGSIAPVDTRVIAPAVPFAPELLPATSKNRRSQYAAWLTHPENPFFAKSIVNRLWQWLMGTGIVEPVDELDSTKPRNRELLALLANDLVANGYDLKRTIREIIGSRAYGLDSRVPEGLDEDDAVDAWAAYPLKPLRGDQLASALIQSGSFWTYNQSRAPLLRFARFTGIGEFTKRHGDDLDLDEPEGETLLQRLHLLNGKTTYELTKADEAFSPVTRLPGLSPTDEDAVDNAFLMTLTRHATAAEKELFSARLRACVSDTGKPDTKKRHRVVSDLMWALVNTTEFAWAH